MQMSWVYIVKIWMKITELNNRLMRGVNNDKDEYDYNR
jgi:hypothetical protein